MLLERKEKLKAYTQFKKQTFETTVVNKDNSTIGASCIIYLTLASHNPIFMHSASQFLGSFN
jgi:predicted transcriptional regulator